MSVQSYPKDLGGIDQDKLQATLTRAVLQACAAACKACGDAVRRPRRDA